MKQAFKQLSEKIKQTNEQNKCSEERDVDGMFYRSYCATFTNYEQAVKSAGQFCTIVKGQQIYDDWSFDLSHVNEQDWDKVLSIALD